MTTESVRFQTLVKLCKVYSTAVTTTNMDCPNSTIKFCNVIEIQRFEYVRSAILLCRL